MNLIFWINLWGTLTSAWTKFINFCAKYWQALVGLVLVLVGYLLGKEFNNANIDKVDAEAKLEAIKKQKEEEAVLLGDHLKDRETLLEKKHEELLEVERQKDRNISELSNNDEKLDSILKDKHDLKKGD